MMLVFFKNVFLDIVSGFSVLMVIFVVLFYFFDKIRYRENLNFLYVWIIWLGIDVIKYVLDISVYFLIYGWKIFNKVFRFYSGFNLFLLNSLLLKRIFILLNNICCFMFVDKIYISVKYFIFIELKKLLSWSIGIWCFFLRKLICYYIGFIFLFFYIFLNWFVFSFLVNFSDFLGIF